MSRTRSLHDAITMDARGDVEVPDAMLVALRVVDARADLSPLADLPGGGIDFVILADRRANDATLTQIIQAPGLRGIDARGTRASDDGARACATAKDLRWVHLANTRVTDTGVATLKELNVEELSLAGPRMTDASLDHIGTMEALRTLVLDATRITDEGLARIARLTQLQTLFLRNTQIGDNGLGHLSELRALRLLVVQRTQVTPAGLEHLPRNPHLQVSLDRPDLALEARARRPDLIIDGIRHS